MKGLLPTLAPAEGAVLVACQDESLRSQAMKTAAALRDAGSRVDMVLEPKKPKWIFKHADRLGVSHVVLVAPREAEQGLVRVKSLAAGEQSDVAFEDLPAWFAALPETPL